MSARRSVPPSEEREPENLTRPQLVSEVRRLRSALERARADAQKRKDATKKDATNVAVLSILSEEDAYLPNDVRIRFFVPESDRNRSFTLHWDDARGALEVMGSGALVIVPSATNVVHIRSVGHREAFGL